MATNSITLRDMFRNRFLIFEKVFFVGYIATVLFARTCLLNPFFIGTIFL